MRLLLRFFLQSLSALAALSALIVLLLSSAAPAAQKCSVVFRDPLSLLTQSEKTEVEHIKKQILTGKLSRHRARQLKKKLAEITRVKLERAGFTAKLVTISEPGKANAYAVEILGYNRKTTVGRVMQRSSERFQISFIVDPLAKDKNDMSEGYYSESMHSIVLDLQEVENLDLVSPVILHEIRHVYFAYLTKNKVATPFQGELFAARGRKLMKSRYYYEYLSFEEISTYIREANLDLTRLRLGQRERQEVIDTLEELKRLTEAAVGFLELVPPIEKLDPRSVVTFRSDKIVNMGVMLYNAKNEAVSTLYYHFPELTSLKRGPLTAAFYKRLDDILAVAREANSFATEQLRLLNSSH